MNLTQRAGARPYLLQCQLAWNGGWARLRAGFWLALLACISGFSTLGSAQAAAPAVLLRDEPVRAQPQAQAAAVAQLPRGQTLDVLARQGGWLQVRSGAVSGWVRVLSVRLGAGLGGPGLGDALALVGTRADPTRVVAVAGLRGLDAQMLSSASFNAAEMQRLEGLHITPQQLEEFARRGNLQTQTLAMLPRPPAPAAAPDAATPFGGSQQ